MAPKHEDDYTLLRKGRKVAGLTQLEMGKQLRISESLVSRYELNGRRLPKDIFDRYLAIIREHEGDDWDWGYLSDITRRSASEKLLDKVPGGIGNPPVDFVVDRQLPAKSWLERQCVEGEDEVFRFRSHLLDGALRGATLPSHAKLIQLTSFFEEDVFFTHSAEDISKRNMYDQWKGLLVRALEKGFEVQQVHLLKRGPHPTTLMTEVLDFLGHDGEYVPYYLSWDEPKHAVFHGLLILPLGTLLSFTTHQAGPPDVAFFYPAGDLEVEHLHRHFELILTQSDPLLMTHQYHSSAYIETLIRAFCNTGSSLMLKADRLSFSTLPMAVYDEWVKSRLKNIKETEENRDRRNDFNRRRELFRRFTEAFESRLEYDPIYQISSLQGIEMMVKNRVFGPSSTWFRDNGTERDSDDAQVSSWHIREFMLRTINLLERYDNYHLCLIDRNLHKDSRQTFIVVSNAVSFLRAWNDTRPEFKPINLEITESSVIRDLGDHFMSKLWGKQPEQNKDKNWIVSKLKDILDSVQDDEI